LIHTWAGVGWGGLVTTLKVGRIFTYIWAEAEADIVKRKAIRNDNLINFFCIFKYLICLIINL